MRKLLLGKNNHRARLLSFIVLSLLIVLGLHIGLAHADSNYTVSGSITFNGSTPGQGQIYFGTSLPIVVSPTAIGEIGSDGSYSVSNLPNGNYYVDVEFTTGTVGNTSLATTTAAVTVNGGNVTQNFTFSTNTITVTAEDASGNPDPGVAVLGQGNYSGTITDGSIAFTGDVGTEGTTDSNGTVVLAILPGTGYQACALANGTYSYCSEATTNSDGTQAATIYLFPPTAPSSLTAPSPTNQAPVLSWTAPAQATFYSVFRDGTYIDTTTAPTYTDTTATPGTHSYYVIAVNSAGVSAASNTISVTYSTTVPIAPTITSPSSLQINARDATNFTVTTPGTPTPSITESGSLPAGLTFTDNGDGTATLSGQASTTNRGYYFLTLTATSSAGTTSQNFVLSVNNAQEAPHSFHLTVPLKATESPSALR
jgi:hypothetical protein